MLRFAGALLLLTVAAPSVSAQTLDNATSFTFIVNSDADEGDTDLSDGACVAATGGCTLRAAVEQGNAMPGTDLVEIVVQAPEVVVAYPADGFVITRDNMLIRGARALAGCGTTLPLLAFGEEGQPGSFVTRGAIRPDDDEAIGFLILADNVAISGLGVTGFDTGIAVGDQSQSGQGYLSCLSVSENETGIAIVNGSPAGHVTSSAVYQNAGVGIDILPFADADILRNCIGLDPSCATRAGNQVGISTSTAITISDNVVSGNDIGIIQTAGGSGAIEVLDNKVGTDYTGRIDIGNRVGLSLATSFPDGSPGQVRDNLISGNDEVGLRCELCEVEGNFVGVDVDGRSALPNGIGMALRGNGMALSLARASNNLVSGNDSTAIQSVCGGGAISGNVIGLNVAGNAPIPNGGPGIQVPYCDSDDQGTIGTTNITDNTVAFNGGDGILLGGVQTVPYDIEGVALRENRIWSNDGLGIALASYVETTPAPAVDSVRVAGDVVTVYASLVGESAQEYAFEFFSSAAPDPSGEGEGQTPIGLQAATANQIGFASVVFTTTTVAVPAGAWITATATTEDVVTPYDIEVDETSPFSNAVQVLAPGGAVIAVEPLSLEFGQVPLGSTRDLSFTIANNGSAPLTGEIQSSDTFTGNGFVFPEATGAFSLDPGASKTVWVRLQPGSLGVKSASVSVVHDAPNEPSPVVISLSGEGVTAAPVIAVDPVSLGFGSVTVGDARVLSTWVANLGTGTLSGTVAAGDGFVANGYKFLLGQGAFSVGAGDSLEVRVQLKPGSVGAKLSSIRVSHGASNTASPVVVDLLGQGVAANVQIAVSSSSIDFGSIPVGTTRLDTLVIRHIGGSDNLIGSVSDFGDLTEAGFYYAAGGGLFDIAPGDSHLVVMAYSPDTEGSSSAQLKVAHNASNEPATILVDLSGEGTVPQSRPLLVVSVSDTVDFGQVPVGVSLSRTLEVSNTGAAALSATLAIVNDAEGQFAVDTPSISVDPGSSRAVELSFAPTATGQVEAVFRITHNAENVESPLEISLVAEGIGAGALGRPVLIEPPNGSASVTVPVRFSWNAVATADDYLLEIATASDFSEIVLQEDVDSTNVPDVELEPGTAHFWRVTARRDGAESSSDTWSFTTVRVNRAPVAVNDSTATLPGQAVVIDALANDVDPDGDVLRIVGISEAPLNGIAVYSTSILQYFPNAGFTGNDRFRYRVRDTGGLESSALVFVTVGSGTDAEAEGVPITTELGTVYPNPVVNSATLPFQLAQSGYVRIALYDALGQRVRVLFDGSAPAGRHDVTLETSELSAGAYLCTMEADGRRHVRMIAVLR